MRMSACGALVGQSDDYAAVVGELVTWQVGSLVGGEVGHAVFDVVEATVGDLVRWRVGSLVE